MAHAYSSSNMLRSFTLLQLERIHHTYIPSHHILRTMNELLQTTNQLSSGDPTLQVSNLITHRPNNSRPSIIVHKKHVLHSTNETKF